MTSYEEIYKKFLTKITDFEILEMNDNDAREMLKMWFDSAIAKFKQCQSDLSDRDDELETFNVDLTDLEKEVLSILMVSEWLEPQLNSVLFTKQFFGGKDEKFYSQSSHHAELMLLQERNEKQANLLLNRYRILNNTYLDR